MRIENAPNYEILSNMSYIQQFQFTSIDMVTNNDEAIISETILKSLYMAYTRDGFKNVEFSKAINHVHPH